MRRKNKGEKVERESEVWEGWSRDQAMHVLCTYGESDWPKEIQAQYELWTSVPGNEAKFLKWQKEWKENLPYPGTEEYHNYGYDKGVLVPEEERTMQSMPVSKLRKYTTPVQESKSTEVQTEKSSWKMRSDLLLRLRLCSSP